jgi:2-oxoglutarate ferredoxin oxidoreductase subunit alpha
VVDIIVAFDRASVILHEKELSEIGIIVYDPAMLGETFTRPDFLGVPFLDLAVSSGGDKVMSNIVAIGAVLGMLGMGIELLFDVLLSTLKKRDEDTVNKNKVAAIAGYNYAGHNCVQCSFSVVQLSGQKMLLSTNDAIAAGAIASGCKFYSAYPMTPSTGIMLYMAGKAKEYGIIVEQAEDEIAAINMALGASFAGVRAMTGTSGGGFALMVEGLSLAAMTETPVVIALAQRPGPATGLPTKTEQGDLLFALHAGHGEFPRVILAPGKPEQGFLLANKAFEISQKYQIPVFILTDQYLADTQWTVEHFDLDGLLSNEHRTSGETACGGQYKRHAFTDSGVSPFCVPGTTSGLVVTDSDEHNEEGHIIEDAATRIRMVDKRLFKKLPLIQREIEPPLFYGNNKPEIMIIGWGSTYGIMKEAVDIMSKKRNIAMLHFSEIYPFPSVDKFDYLGMMKEAKMTICVEQNATGQFARLMKTEAGFECSAMMNRYDGRPYLLEEFLGELYARIG